MITLLYKYSELIITFNIIFVGENETLDDIRILRDEKKF